MYLQDQKRSFLSPVSGHENLCNKVYKHLIQAGSRERKPAEIRKEIGRKGGRQATGVTFSGGEADRWQCQGGQQEVL